MVNKCRTCSLVFLWQSKLASLAHVLRVTGVHTVCRREDVGARRQLGINLWIDPPNARASAALGVQSRNFKALARTESDAMDQRAGVAPLLPTN